MTALVILAAVFLVAAMACGYFAWRTDNSVFALAAVVLFCFAMDMAADAAKIAKKAADVVPAGQ